MPIVLTGLNWTRRSGKPMEFKSAYFEDDERRRVTYVSAGDPEKPLMLCLHGFPEYWGAWRDIMPLSGAALPRGRARSARLSASRSSRRASMPIRPAISFKDMNGAGRSPLSPMCRSFFSDMTGARPLPMPSPSAARNRLRALIVANGVHPYTFQKAIIDDPQQRAASQYMTLPAQRWCAEAVDARKQIMRARST